MPLPTRFDSGTVIRRDTNRLQLSPNAEPPFMRMTDPLDLFLSSATVAHLAEAARRNNKDPEATLVEVAVREFAGEKFILVIPTDDKNPLKENLSIRANEGGGYIRTADDVLAAGGIRTQPGRAYRMEAGLVEDKDFGWVVAASWTEAAVETVHPRTAAQPAAGQDPGTEPA